MNSVELLSKTFRMDDIEVELLKWTETENGVQEALTYEAYIREHGNVRNVEVKTLSEDSKLLKLLDLNLGEEISALGRTVRCTNVFEDVEEY